VDVQFPIGQHLFPDSNHKEVRVPEAVDPGSAPIGGRLRAARLAARKTMAEVADEAGLTKGFLSKLERDLANVSVASLMRLCDALGIPVGSLFEQPKGEVVRAGERPRVNFGGTGGIREYLLTPSAERRVQAILSDIAPGGGSGEEPYSLPADVEFVFVLRGSLEVTLDGAPVTLADGDAFTFPAGAPHSFLAPPDGEPAQVLWVVSPALPDDTRY
jgi:transcriptional regulator with XRE-family HTH domain